MVVNYDRNNVYSAGHWFDNVNEKEHLFWIWKLIFMVFTFFGSICLQRNWKSKFCFGDLVSRKRRLLLVIRCWKQIKSRARYQMGENLKVVSCNKQHALRNVNNGLNTNVYSYLETSGDQSSNPYLNVVHFLNTRAD